MANRLKESTSPYLRQHENNPVDWHLWDEPTLQKAKTENKLIFLSIGYSACHWCHVMAHESFEDPDTASLMNQHFINIKVDREERPDIDSIYMDAVVRMNGNGGWPLSVFLTPELLPFHGGTYYPPVPRYGMPSFKQVLARVAGLWQTQPNLILELSKNYTPAQQNFLEVPAAEDPDFHATLQKSRAMLLNSLDMQHGGWGKAPKFPHSMALDFLMMQIPLSQEGLAAITISLDSMARGGLYDVVGGGFARYATDQAWLVPHFEKMLYDNALLAWTYLRAWSITKIDRYHSIAEETLDFMQRELHMPDGGFASSLDADSEGVEGKFYLWAPDEIAEVLGDDLYAFQNFFELYPFEAGGILRRKQAVEGAALTAQPDRKDYKRWMHKLLTQRETRVRPHRDEKIITAWNALAIKSFAYASRLTGSQQYLQVAQQTAEFLIDKHLHGSTLMRSSLHGQLSLPGFLEDYAGFASALLGLYQADFDPKWLNHAEQLNQLAIELFKDPAGGFFDATAQDTSLIYRPKSLDDNISPSGSALMFENALLLHELSGNPSLDSWVEADLAGMKNTIERYPLAYPYWLRVMSLRQNGIHKFTLLGNSQQIQELQRLVNNSILPNSVIERQSYEADESNKPARLIYCFNNTCAAPLSDPKDVVKLLQELETRGSQ